MSINLPNIIKIETYRKFDIFYDIEENIFYSALQEKYDLKKEPKRQSVIDTRKVIDEYIKKNANFEPFEALLGGSRYRDEERKLSSVPERIKILGIKKDGGLMCEHTQKNYRGIDKKFQLNKTSYSDDRMRLFEISEDLDLILATVAFKELEIDRLRKEISEELARVEPLDLSFIEENVGKESLKK